MHLFESLLFWYSIALVILFSLAWWKGRASVTGLIDDKIAQYTLEIEDARTLRVEALALYTEAKENHQRSRIQIEEIISAAHNEAELLISEAAERRQKNSKSILSTVDYRIEQQRKNFLNSFRALLVARAIDIARDALVRNISEEKMNKSRITRLVGLVKDL